MENIALSWCSWCRLCGKQDANDVNILLNGNEPLTAGKLTLNEALKRYFWLRLSSKDLFPKNLCSDCSALLSSMMLFNEHVQKVQQMYKFLLKTPAPDASELKSIRLQFGVSDFPKLTKESVSADIRKATENRSVEKVTVDIKQEDWSIESNASEDEANNDEDTESIYLEEVLYDTENNVNDGHEEYDDRIEVVSDGFSWGEDYEKLDHKGQRNDEYNYSNTVRTVNQEEYINDCQGEDEDPIEVISDEDTLAEAQNNDIMETNKKENVANDSQQEDEDPFEAVSEESSWSENQEKMNRNGSGNRKHKDAGSLKTSTYMFYKPSKDKNNASEDFEMDIVCKECGKKFYLFSTYCQHMEMSHGSAPGVDKCCPVCNRVLQTFYHLGRHMRYHMPLELRHPIKCPECDSRFNTSAQLDVHINHKHRNTKPFICEVCGFRGGTKHSLTQHMFIHTDNAPFECEVCKKKFKKKSRLNFHMDIHGPNKFVCSVCGLQLNSRATLKNHLLVHSDEMQHKCEFCDKSFKRSKYLKTHLLLHTGLKPYPCNFCDRSFGNRTNCRGHMRQHHPSELAELDASGNKAYTQNVPRLEALKEVCKTITVDNLRPVTRFTGNFICPYCNGRFSARHNLRAHTKKRHPEQFAILEATGNTAYGKDTTKSKLIIEWRGYGKSDTCDFCDQKYINRICCRAHIRRKHLDKLVSRFSISKKARAMNRQKLEAIKTENDEEDLKPCVAELSAGFTNAISSVEESASPLDLTPCTPTVTATSIQDLFLLLD